MARHLVKIVKHLVDVLRVRLVEAQRQARLAELGLAELALVLAAGVTPLGHHCTRLDLSLLKELAQPHVGAACERLDLGAQLRLPLIGLDGRLGGLLDLCSPLPQGGDLYRGKVGRVSPRARLGREGSQRPTDFRQIKCCGCARAERRVREAGSEKERIAFERCAWREVQVALTASAVLVYTRKDRVCVGGCGMLEQRAQVEPELSLCDLPLALRVPCLDDLCHAVRRVRSDSLQDDEPELNAHRRLRLFLVQGFCLFLQRRSGLAQLFH